MRIPSIADNYGVLMSYYALLYYVVNNFVELRAACREEHLRLAQQSAERGELQLGGALGNPAERALIVFYGKDRSVAEDFALKDPYVRNGLVVRWEVQPWTVVVGAAAVSP